EGGVKGRRAAAVSGRRRRRQPQEHLLRPVVEIAVGDAGEGHAVGRLDHAVGGGYAGLEPSGELSRRDRTTSLGIGGNGLRSRAAAGSDRDDQRHHGGGDPENGPERMSSHSHVLSVHRAYGFRASCRPNASTKSRQLAAGIKFTAGNAQQSASLTQDETKLSRRYYAL